MAKTRVSRSIEIPDPLRISRYRKIPELGPRILFFSGGTALNGLCKTLKNYTHNSTHLVTPFDSGGSSAKLRKAFSMPAIGDLRSRLMALADESVLGHPEIVSLFQHRFPANVGNKELRHRLISMAQGESRRIACIVNPMRQLICNQLGFFLDAMPAKFDLRGASIGNLILVGGYLNNHKELDPIIFLFSKLVNVHGTVRAIVDDDLHLAADLGDGSIVTGQHRLTGKEVPPLTHPIQRLRLSGARDKYVEASSQLKKKNRKLIEAADLICYPPGSFFTSLLANLLPRGVGTAIATNHCPKVYVPNLGSDPEQLGSSIPKAVETLLDQLRQDAGQKTHTGNLINFVMVDRRSKYPGKIEPDRLRKLGVEPIEADLVSNRSAPFYDNDLLVSALLSLT